MDDPISVLHIDDEPGLTDLVKTYLERDDERFDVVTASNGSAGLDLLADREFDCILSDYDMPGLTGIEVLETVRERYPDLPFILYTGKGSEEVASEAISSGVTDYLQKQRETSHYTVLANRIRNSVDQYRTQAKLKDREERLNLFFEQSPLGVIRWDEQFQFGRINETAEQILGYEEDELIGESWELIVPEDERDDIEDVVSNLLDNKGGFQSINENSRKDGDRVVCEWYNRAVTDENGEVIAVYHNFRISPSERSANGN